MEVPLEDRTAVADSQAVQPQLAASEEAVAFLLSIEPAELQKCVFPDSLVTVSEGGREVGEFTVTLEFAQRLHRPCLLLHAHSRGALDDTPCGTTVTAYLSTDLEILEEDHHEYVKPQGQQMERRCHMVQRDGQMFIEKVTAEGEEVKQQNDSYALSVVKGLVTEGSNLLLMRLMALRKAVPQNMVFISFGQQLHITHTTYRELGPKLLEVGRESLEVFGVERTVDSGEDVPTTWQCYFLADGHLASRVQVGSPVTMRLLKLPPRPGQYLADDKLLFAKIPLVLEEDMELHCKYLDRKEELKADHATYMRKHPELRALLADFLQFLLLRKPDDIFHFAKEYFLPFASRHPPGPSFQ